MTDQSCAFAGTVVHERVTPKRHAFAYRVFSLCLDVDDIDRLDGRLRWFSRNRRNLMSFYDRDHGRADGQPVGETVRAILADAGLAEAGARILLLCYPRVLGFVFNPLSVYFCYRSDGALGAIIYEVSNTFGERKSYVIPAHPTAQGVVSQRCDKEMYVSPFTDRDGSYAFHVLPPGERVVVGVNLSDAAGLVLITHFTGDRRTLDDRSILSLLLRHPLMTLKVVASIHIEALRLWLKGVPLVTRHTSPPFSYTVISPNLRD